MSDFRMIWVIIGNFLNTEFTIWGFTFTWLSVLLFVIIATFILGALGKWFSQ